MSCSCRLFGLTLCLAGLALSLYAYYVEVMMEASGGQYEALCDVSEKVSCTKVFNTSFAKGFGIVDKVVGELNLYFHTLYSIPQGALIELIQVDVL